MTGQFLHVSLSSDTCADVIDLIVSPLEPCVAGPAIRNLYRVHLPRSQQMVCLIAGCGTEQFLHVGSSRISTNLCDMYSKQLE